MNFLLCLAGAFGLVALGLTVVVAASWFTVWAVARILALWKDRHHYVRYARVLAAVGSVDYQWQTADLATEAALKEFYRALDAERMSDPQAMACAMAAAFQVLSRRSAWWRLDQLKSAKLPALDKIQADEIARLQTSVNMLSKTLLDARNATEQALKLADEREELLCHVVNEDRARRGLEPMGILTIDEAMDGVRLRMGRAKKAEGLSSARLEDFLIDLGCVCQFVEHSHVARGIEPPPSFFHLQKLIRDVKPGKP